MTPHLQGKNKPGMRKCLGHLESYSQDIKTNVDEKSL
jgi:hypothetical protein